MKNGRADSPDLRWMIWAGPVVFLIHDVEELVTVEAWTRSHRDRVPGILQGLLPIETAAFGVSIALLLVLFLAVSWWAHRARGRGRALDLFLLLVAVVGVNAVGHAVQAVLFGGYVPGIVTAVALSLPYAVWVLQRVREMGLRSGRWQAGAVVVAAVIQGPAAALALVLGKVVAG